MFLHKHVNKENLAQISLPRRFYKKYFNIFRVLNSIRLFSILGKFMCRLLSRIFSSLEMKLSISFQTKI